jgi:hypothetical protein
MSSAAPVPPAASGFPNTKRDGESGLHDGVHFGATCVSD